MKDKMLEGKVAIISGASYGMGFTMAELFAREGAKVVMTARGADQLQAAVDQLRGQGYDVVGQQADNKRLEDVQRVMQRALDTYGDLPLRSKGIHGFGGLGHQIASLRPLAIGSTMAAGPRLALRWPRPPKLSDLSRLALRPVRGAGAMD